MDEEQTTDEGTEVADARSGKRRYRIRRLALKELRETLRDRRTIITLVLMPLLVYPALSLVFKTFLLSNMTGMMPANEPLILNIAFAGEGDKDSAFAAFTRLGALFGPIESSQDSPTESFRSQFAPADEHTWSYVTPEKERTVAEVVASGDADVGVVFELDEKRTGGLGQIELFARSDVLSQLASRYLATYFKEINELDINQRLIRRGLSTEPAIEFTETRVGPEQEPPGKAFPLASLIPLVLVLMTITGAVYPAIDLTAGERERGTLETLMAAPVPRFGILFAKFLAVWTVAVMTAFLNVIGMFATVWAFQLDKQFGEEQIFSLSVMFQILLLLVLFAAFFSALLLVVTSFAKSFKEAQVYLIPIILLSLGPGLMAMAPGMSLEGIYSVTPMVNILLLARDVLQNQVMLVPAALAILSTLLYTYLAIRMAARIFGSDSILFSGSGTVAEMLLRPVDSNRVVPITATLFCLAMVVPANFASIGFIGRMSGETTAGLEARYLMMGLFTFLAFAILPFVVALHQRTRFRTGFGLNVPRLNFVLAAILLGVSLWTILMSLTAGWHEAYEYFWGAEKSGAWHDRLIETTTQHIERIRLVSPWVIALCFSIIPAICEEWFFRGMLLRSLLKSNSAFKAIVLSAIVFGSFHMLSNSVIALDRLIPSTLIGGLLGWLAYKSGSILPGILLHSLSNAFVVFLPYYQPSLSEYSWFPGEKDPLPVAWVVVGCIVAAVGIAVVWLAPKANEEDSK